MGGAGGKNDRAGACSNLPCLMHDGGTCGAGLLGGLDDHRLADGMYLPSSKTSIREGAKFLSYTVPSPSRSLW